jgi:hypothetical protein
MGGSSKTSGKKGKVGDTTANCAQEGDIAVIANQVSDVPTPFKEGLDVNVTPSGGSGKTDQKGLKVFTKLVTNDYKVTASLSGALKDKFELLSKSTVTVHVPAGGIGVANFDVAAFAKVKVKVVHRKKGKDGKETETILDGVKFELAGPSKKQGTTTKDAGGVTIEKVLAGSYTVKVTALGSHAGKFKVPAPVKVSIKGDTTQDVVIAAAQVALLRVVLWDQANKPVSGAAWNMTAPVALKGTTGANGMIEIPDLELAPAAGSLSVKFAPKPAPPPAPAPGPGPAPAPGTPPPYPPEIDETHTRSPRQSRSPPRTIRIRSNGPSSSMHSRLSMTRRAARRACIISASRAAPSRTWRGSRGQ